MQAGMLPINFPPSALNLAQTAGSCPISPLAVPRRLTDGALAGALPLAGAGGGSGSMAALAGTVSGVAASMGAHDAGDSKQQQRSPMRKRIVNLTASADALLAGGGLPRSGSPSPEPGGGLGEQAGGGSAGGSPLATAAGSLAAAAAPGGRSRGMSMAVLGGMQTLMASNPALPVGLRSSLRASAPNPGPLTHDDK